MQVILIEEIMLEKDVNRTDDLKFKRMWILVVRATNTFPLLPSIVGIYSIFT